MRALYLVLILISVRLVGAQTSPPTTNPCPGGYVALQDIAVLYDLTFYPTDSLELSKLIQNAIGYTLFNGPAYWYDPYLGERITQIITLPFPNTGLYDSPNDGYSTVNSSKALRDRLTAELNRASSPDLGHPTDSSFSDALKYLENFVQPTRRPFPVKNTVIIISKRADDVDISQGLVERLKSAGTIVMTLGAGTDNTTNLAQLASGPQYVFNIHDFTNEIDVDNAAQWIAQHLAQDCGTTFDPAATATTTVPTTTTPVSTGPVTSGSTTTTTTTPSASLGSTRANTATSQESTSSNSPPSITAQSSTPTSSALTYSFSVVFMVILLISLV